MPGSNASSTCGSATPPNSPVSPGEPTCRSSCNSPAARIYVHEPRLAPTREILTAYRNGGGWPEYREVFLKLLRERRFEEALGRDCFADRTVLLCSEASPERCHRRLVLEYLNRARGGIRTVHL